MPYISLISEMNDPAIMDTIKGLIPVPVQQRAPGHYTLDFGQGMEFYFGMNGNTFYATTAKGAVVNLVGEEKSPYSEKVGKLFHNTYSVLNVDLVLVRDMLDVMIANGTIDREVAMALPILGLFESVEMTVPNTQHVNFVVHMTDKDKNAATVIYDTTESLMGMYLGMMMMSQM